jgi:hypothetical protein
MRQYQCKFGRNRSVSNGVVLLRPEQFFASILRLIPAQSLEHHLWHSLHAAVRGHVWSKPVSIERHFTLEATTIFRDYLALYSSAVAGISHLAVSKYVPLLTQIWPKSVCIEGHFTLEARTVFRDYLVLHSTAFAGTSNLALCPCGSISAS